MTQKNKIENYEEGIDQALKERINSKGIIKTIPDFEVERQKLKNKLNNRRRSSVKKNVLRNISSGKENKELSKEDKELREMMRSNNKKKLLQKIRDEALKKKKTKIKVNKNKNNNKDNE